MPTDPAQIHARLDVRNAPDSPQSSPAATAPPRFATPETTEIEYACRGYTFAIRDTDSVQDSGIHPLSFSQLACEGVATTRKAAARIDIQPGTQAHISADHSHLPACDAAARRRKECGLTLMIPTF